MDTDLSISKNSKQLRKTFPKEGEKKLKETIQKLRARNRYLEKKIKWYEKKAITQTIQADQKDIILGNKELPKKPETTEDFRKRFLKEFRESLKKRDENG